jgi:lauroyl/myristoyl acyltransferase
VLFRSHTLSMQGIQPLVLTIPNPQGGRRVEFESREKAGANLLPGSFPALRKALRHLQQGGFVATGIDRPVPEPRLRPQFFGYPSALPLHYIFLALKAKVPVRILATIRRPDGRNIIQASELIAMEPHPDRETEALQNAERVLRIAEEFIRQAPTQWSVSLPVWPDMPDRIPESPR